MVDRKNKNKTTKNIRLNNIVVYFCIIFVSMHSILALPGCRDCGNDFWVPEIGSDNSRFTFILFLYPHVVPSRSFKWPSFLGADFHFWSCLGLTRNVNVRQKNISSFLSFFTFLPALFVSIQHQYRVVRIPQVECWSKSGLWWRASWAVHGCMALVHGILGLPSLFLGYLNLWRH